MRDALLPSSLSTLTLLAVICASLLSACATPPRIAQKKSVEVAGQKLELGGEYDARHTALKLSINADPVMSGRFPPYTPTLRLSSQYQGMEVSANCYFSSVLSSKPGILGIVSGAVQSGHGKSGDKCDVLVGGKLVEALYF